MSPKKGKLTFLQYGDTGDMSFGPVTQAQNVAKTGRNFNFTYLNFFPVTAILKIMSREITPFLQNRCSNPQHTHTANHFLFHFPFHILYRPYPIFLWLWETSSSEPWRSVVIAIDHEIRKTTRARTIILGSKRTGICLEDIFSEDSYPCRMGAGSLCNSHQVVTVCLLG